MEAQQSRIEVYTKWILSVAGPLRITVNAVRLNDFAAVSHLQYPNVNVFEKYSRSTLTLNGVKNERYACLHENDHFAIQSRPRFECYSLLVYM